MIAAVEEQPAYSKTSGGLVYKQIKASDGDIAKPGDIVTATYTATLLSTGQLVSGNRFQTGQRTDSFILGEAPVDDRRDFAWGPPSRSNELVPLLQEAVDGKRVGEQRRVSIPPSSGFARLADDTVQLELELVEVRTGPSALAYTIEQGWKTLNAGPFFLLAILLLYGPVSNGP